MGQSTRLRPGAFLTFPIQYHHRSLTEVAVWYRTSKNMKKTSKSEKNVPILIKGHEMTVSTPLPEAVRDLAHLLAKIAADQWLTLESDCPELTSNLNFNKYHEKY